MDRDLYAVLQIVDMIVFIYKYWYELWYLISPVTQLYVYAKAYCEEIKPYTGSEQGHQRKLLNLMEMYLF